MTSTTPKCEGIGTTTTSKVRAPRPRVRVRRRRSVWRRIETPAGNHSGFLALRTATWC